LQEPLTAKCDLHRSYVEAIARAEKDVTARTLDKLAQGAALACGGRAELRTEPRDAE